MKIAKALWAGFDEIFFELNKDCPNVPKAELENTAISAASVARADRLAWARLSSYYADGQTAYFVISPDSFPNAERSKFYYLCGDFNGWNDAVGNPKWLMREFSDDARVYFRLEVKMSELWRDRPHAFQFKFACADGSWLEPEGCIPNLVGDGNHNLNLLFDPSRTGSHAFVVRTRGMCQLGSPVVLRLPELRTSAAVDESLLLSQIHSSAKLGAVLENGATVFRIFAPRAKAVYVSHWAAGESGRHLLVAETADDAVWTARADSDLRGHFYTYHIDGENFDNTTLFDRHKPVADPYANAMSGSSGVCIVKYDSQLPTPSDAFVPPKWHDLVVVEAHLRDVLANAAADISPAERLTFAGLEKWLVSEDCYLRKCGANCVELQPIQEFTYENPADYEWGYMPVGWFAPSSAYAADAASATQNDDFARLVAAFHRAGIAVVLDVVYNHFGEPNFLARIDKQYYFETDYNGNLSNFSGCGNDFKTTTPMARRMILESLKKLVLRYGVDGFRFDLAELVGFETLVEIERELKKIKPSVILIAEPWSFRGHIAGKLKRTGFASWNDGFREFMLQYAKGCGNFEGFKYFMRGSLGGVASFAAQTVNYVESHDDMCLFDRITHNFDYPSREDIFRYKTAYALTLLAHGIPMLAEGFDLLRTKRGKNNTYKDGEANRLDYWRAESFPEVRRWLRALVRFRLSRDGAALRRDGLDSPAFCKFYKANECAAAVMFNADLSDTRAPQIFAAFNPTDTEAEFAVGGDLDGFVRIADNAYFDPRGLDSGEVARGEVLRLPRMSLAVFLKR